MAYAMEAMEGINSCKNEREHYEVSIGRKIESEGHPWSSEEIEAKNYGGDTFWDDLGRHWVNTFSKQGINFSKN